MPYYYVYPTGQALHFFSTTDITPQLKYDHQPFILGYLKSHTWM